MTEQTNSTQITINGKTFTIQKFTPIDGRNIVISYPLTAFGKVEGYKKNEDAMRLLMKFVEIDGISLDSDEAINEHVDSWDMLVSLELAALKHNVPWFEFGTFESLILKVADFLTGILGDKFAAIIDNVSSIIAEAVKVGEIEKRSQELLSHALSSIEEGMKKMLADAQAAQVDKE